MLGSFLGKQKTLKIYSRHYLIHPNWVGLTKVEPGKHKVVVDEAGKFIIGYAIERNNEYFLHPFVEELPPQLEPRKIKIKIRGRYATSYMTITPEDPLNELFFKPVNPEQLRDVKAIPNPADQADVA